MKPIKKLEDLPQSASSTESDSEDSSEVNSNISNKDEEKSSAAVAPLDLAKSRRESIAESEADKSLEDSKNGNLEIQLTKEIIESIKNPADFYDYSAVNQVLEIACAQYDDLMVIPIEGGDYLANSLRKFRESGKNRAVVPLFSDSHFTGIYIEKLDGVDEYCATYFDPLGSEGYHDIISENVKKVLHTELGITGNGDIILVRNALQSSYQNQNNTICDNNHCGAFVNFMLYSFVNESFVIEEDGSLEIFDMSGDYQTLGNLGAESSDAFGRYLRERDCELLQGGNLEDWQKSIQELRRIILEAEVSRIENESESEEDELETSSILYKQDEMSASFNSSLDISRREFLSHSTSSGRNVSGKVKMKVIETDENGKLLKTRDSHKQAGYDENFMTKHQKSGRWRQIDESLGLRKGDVRFSEEAFEHSRFPTNSYVHFRAKDGSISGHAGGLIKPIDHLPKTLTRKPLEDAKMMKNEPSFIRRHSSGLLVKKLSGTEGQKTEGSLGGKGFHTQRQKVIDNVIVEATKSKAPEVKKNAAIKATAEALKFVVNDTVGYKDNTEENLGKFKGITVDGLNLEDDHHREYALKHYQAVRDRGKLAVLKHEGRLNKVDSENEGENSETEMTKDQEIALINRKLSRTKLEEKYHGKITKEEKRHLSPMRSVSPYSRSNIEHAIEELRNAKDYVGISSVYSTPIPAIRPTEDLINQVLEPLANVAISQRTSGDERFPKSVVRKPSVVKTKNEVKSPSESVAAKR